MGANRLRDGNARIVARRNHERVQGRLERHGIAFQKPRARLAHRGRLVVDRHGQVEGRVLKRHNHRHDLRERRDFHFRIHVTREIHGAIGANKHGVRRLDIGACIGGKATRGNGFVANDVGIEHLGESGRRRGKGKRTSKHACRENATCARNNGSARRCERFESIALMS